MITVIAHELAESLSDPYFNAWYDRKRDENADKCNFNFGPTKVWTNGAKYNIAFGGKAYLIQQNWDPVLQKCAQTA
ncbi:unnamed protein product [Rotaria sp. Silwood1]|nr:unnamed protein product [Rotaria sp. Silwood1]